VAFAQSVCDGRSPGSIPLFRPDGNPYACGPAACYGSVNLPC
jgi:hypothetical protein